jgi:class 3 adenylate cyclase/tetratricopeptide (TPR) repeat protein
MAATQAQTPPAPQHELQPISQADSPPQDTSPRISARPQEAERRQLTVLFCDLADSTRLAGQLDPEDLREVVLAYQASCVEVLQRFDGHVAQYLDDGLLVYFGYPQAHEDDAQRAVRAGLGILDAMGTLNTRLAQARGIRLAVRIGIHTGPVVVGTMGSGGRHEQLALGEPPNLAARLQSRAAPDTVAISETTHRLVQGYFRCDALGSPSLKGIETPMRVYRVVEESAAQSRLDVAGATGLTPLVGREHEVGLLRGRWAQSRDGLGQVVLLSGEAGIGKSRLVRVLTERVADEGVPWLTLRCSPYHTNSAFYPVIEHLQRLLQWHRNETSAARLAMLEQMLQTAGLPLAEAVPLLATLLTLPVPEQYPPLALSPQRQKQKTQEALVAWLLAETAQQPVLAVWEDLHWADPSTLELLELMLDHVPTARLLLVLTSRPEFRPPWAPRSYVTQLTLTRLPRHQSEEMVLQVTGGKPLPAEVLAQIVAKTDGIPLFVEELVKTVLEAGLVQEDAGRYMLTGPLPPLAIPATLQDALMARLDRLAVVKEVAQLGAVLGREFAYELLQAVAPLDEATLQQALARLVEAELLYQRGLPPQATYIFKHALIQDAAYQSLLKSTRQQLHQRIVQVLAERFPETAKTQPEVLAQHYTEAGLADQALTYRVRATQHATNRSANHEVVHHVGKDMALLAALSSNMQRDQHELDLQFSLGVAYRDLKGFNASETKQAFLRAQELCERVGGEPTQLTSILRGVYNNYFVGGEHRRGREIAAQLLALANQTRDGTHLLQAWICIGSNEFYRGNLLASRSGYDQALSLYAPTQQYEPTTYVLHPRTAALMNLSWVLWTLGYPDQAIRTGHEAIAFSRGLSQPFALAVALVWVGSMRTCCGQIGALEMLIQELSAVVSENHIAHWDDRAAFLKGKWLIAQGQVESGLALLSQALDSTRTTEARLAWTWMAAETVATYMLLREIEPGFQLLTEAFELVERNEERNWEAELYRLEGELLLAQAVPEDSAAEACFHRALNTAIHQSAKSLELRVAMSLGRLWQHQGKRTEARELLASVYGWFTEGFDTADLQGAKALLQALT